jgi:AcrR family transcriptional regulator
MSMSTPATERPLRRDAERNRGRILEAARAVFAERGLCATLDDIAVEAGVGVGTVYRRFPNKDDLIDALFEERMAAVAEIAERALEADDAWEGLVGFVTGAAQLQAEDRGLKELLLGTGRGCDQVSRARERIEPLAREIVARAHAAGALRPGIEAQDLPIIQMMLGTIADCSRDLRPELWRRYLELMLDGMRSGAGHEAPLYPALDRDEVLRATRAWRPPGR